MRLCRLNQASVRVGRQEWRGNAAGSIIEVGIIRNTALYAGYAPGSIALFREVWERMKKPNS